MVIFNAGEAVVHSSYGTGLVTGQKVIERRGKEKTYFCIELSDDRGTLMIPMERLEKTDLRPAVDDMTVIRQVMSSEPEELSDHHRSRQSSLEDKISSGKPKLLAQVLRDLAYRRHTERKLTTTDKKLETRAQKRLLNELAMGMSVTTQTVRKRLNALIAEAMESYVEPAQA